MDSRYSEHFGKVPAFLRPQLRLFLSVDLVGSTALKQGVRFPLSAPEDSSSWSRSGSEWFTAIAGFYRNFDREFKSAWKSYSESNVAAKGWVPGDRPELWKANGDELLYSKRISEVHQVVATVAVWITALRRYRKQLQQHGSPLDVKASGWLAGFPVNNSEVILDLSEEGNSDGGGPRVSVCH